MFSDYLKVNVDANAKNKQFKLRFDKKLNIWLTTSLTSFIFF